MIEWLKDGSQSNDLKDDRMACSDICGWANGQNVVCRTVESLKIQKPMEKSTLRFCFVRKPWFFTMQKQWGTPEVEEQINFTILICSKVLVFHRETITWHPPSPRANQLYDFDLLESVGFSYEKLKIVKLSCFFKKKKYFSLRKTTQLYDFEFFR